MTHYSRISLMASFLLIFIGQLQAQQHTDTSCNVYGNTAQCTSDTTDYGAQQQRAYEQGQQVGNAIGRGLAAAMQRHSSNSSLKHYCTAHPGEVWHFGSQVTGETLSSSRCPTEEKIGAEIAHKFTSHHKEYVICPGNAKLMVAYFEAHDLNPAKEKSYELAYKELRKTSQLQVYAR